MRPIGAGIKETAIRRGSRLLDLRRHKAAIIAALILGAVGVLGMVAYGLLGGAPSQRIVKNAIRDNLLDEGVKMGLMSVEGGGMKLHAIDIVEIGEFKPHRKEWPVKATFIAQLGDSTIYLEGRGEFAIYKDDLGKWQARRLALIAAIER